MLNTKADLANLIAIVAPIFKRPECVHIICNAFLSQTDCNWNLILVNDGEDDEINEIANNYCCKDSRITYHAIKQENCWGHNCRNFGLSVANSEWVVLSGHDNYYVPTFVESVESLLDRNNHKYDLIYWNMIHNYYRYNFSSPPSTPIIHPDGVDPNFLPKAELKPNRIDIGGFAVRTEIARQTGGLKKHSEATDWDYLNELLANNLRIGWINRCLYVHN